MDILINALHAAALKAKDGGISGIAKRWHMSAQPLINRLSQCEEGKSPTLRDMSCIMEDTGDTLPLDILCEMFGGRFVTASHKVADNLTTAMLRAVVENGDICKAVEAAYFDGIIDGVETVEIRRQISEARSALAVLENTLSRSGGF